LKLISEFVVEMVRSRLLWTGLKITLINGEYVEQFSRAFIAWRVKGTKEMKRSFSFEH
jgi:hypothetical protein